MFEVLTNEKYYKIRALDMRILVVASVTTEVGDWSAYIGIVIGISHRIEYMNVVNYGSKLDKGLAYHLFPDIALKYRWRP